MSTRDARETSADRWSSWRRGATVSVTPAGTRLYRVVTCDAERIVGLETHQSDLMDAHSAADLLARLNRTGSLRATEYRISGNELEGWEAEPMGPATLFARESVWIEPFDPLADPDGLASAA